eukprot:TRINITY_DN6005_c0_g1_i1.p1 TRINITY_DN6005_c0_g1~~TRINITY_DN6005_c0_g1_i1.p1  ORF type:complete len:103 (-),score=1.61 TRINITY_DN6005_c0_g1_i1:445-753(-)
MFFTSYIQISFSLLSCSSISFQITLPVKHVNNKSWQYSKTHADMQQPHTVRPTKEQPRSCPNAKEFVHGHCLYRYPSIKRKSSNISDLYKIGFFVAFRSFFL